MNHRLMAAIVSISCGVWLVESPALAQYYGRHLSVSRPSRGPSGRVGRTGGLYTRQRGDTLAIGRGAPMAMRGVGASNMPRANYLGAGWRLGRLRSPVVPQAFDMAQSGYFSRRPSEPMFGWLAGASDHQLRRVTGFQSSLRFSAPLMRSGPFNSPYVGSPYIAPDPEGTAFHQFFGVMPARQTEAAAEEPVAFDSLVAIIEHQNQELLRQSTLRAFEVFKAAMARDADDRGEALARAQTALTALRDVDREVYIPSLLLVHIALERSQLGLAVLHLADAVRRHPNVFVERPDLASYFTKPESLEEQMRRHLRIGDDNPTYSGAYALQAYCAWVLDDRGRVKYALERMAAVSQEAEGVPDPKMDTIRFALAAAAK